MEEDKISLAERIGTWFKLVDLNFHGIYPWIFLAPYVLWLGLRFTLERDRWRSSLPAHLLGCAVFAAASHTFASHAGWNRRVIVTYKAERKESLDETGRPATNIIRTNEFKIVSDGPLPQLSHLPPEIGDSLENMERSMKSGGPEALGSPVKHDSLFWTRGASRNLSELLNVLAYASLVGIAQAVHFHRRSRERERRAAALEAQLTEARLNALQAQLHPHFLFNALNAISTLLRRDTRAAQDALASFSDLLRLALSQSTQPEVALSEDLRFLRRYVEIQATRLGDRLRFEEVVPEETLRCLVPALLLQPLVENAIRHGIEPAPDPGAVRVVVEPRGTRLVLTVEDTGVGFSAATRDQDNPGIGIGLENLRARLKSLYGTEGSIDVGPRPGGGVRVRVEIPLRKMDAVEAPSSSAPENRPMCP